MQFAQIFENIGGPGGTRTPNQAVMSGSQTAANADFFEEYRRIISVISRFVRVKLLPEQKRGQPNG